LETENSTFPSAEHPLGSIGNRFVCHSNIHPTTSFFQLETRTTSGSHKRLHARLVNCSGLCEPSLVSFNQMSEESSQRLSNFSISHPPMASPTMVSPSPTNDRGLPPVPTTTPRSNDTGSGHTNQSESSITTTTVGRLAHFRRSITSQGIPEEVEKLLSASWRSGTNKNYESAWGKWERWCIEQCVNPISATLNDVLSFLTSQYQQGMSYRSINVYRSAISSIHPKIDDYLVGSHPLVSRLMKGIFNSRPPMPKYKTTWPVHKVLTHIASFGPNTSLPLATLTHKLATLLALTTGGRSSDLALLSVNRCNFSDSGVIFHLDGLAKQSRPGHSRPPLEIAQYPSDISLCPVLCLQAYIKITSPFRTQSNNEWSPSQLFIGISKPHQPVQSCTIARWIKSTIQEAGIDSIFSAHSTRAASTTAAISGGATIQEVLQQADWSSVRTFRNHYFRPSAISSFSASVLDTATASKLQC
jgi:site-specific recombinase XerD